jgi:hypothetical protein
MASKIAKRQAAPINTTKDIGIAYNNAKKSPYIAGADVN